MIALGCASWSAPLLADQTSPEHVVTVGEYCEFLNSVAATDTYGLFNPKMKLDFDVNCITRTGSPGSYKYYVVSEKEFLPITYVNKVSVFRFCNWKENHSPVGKQGPKTTETGSYNLKNLDLGDFSTVASSKIGAAYFLPSDYLVNVRLQENEDESLDPFIASGSIGFRVAGWGSGPNSESDTASSGAGKGGSGVIGDGSSHLKGFYFSDNVTGKSGAASSSFPILMGTNPSGSIATVTTASTKAAQITIPLVPVGNPGNQADTPILTGEHGYGAVSAAYQIGKTDVTAEQYCAFLNAVAKKDLHLLYNTNMAADPNVACITRSGEDGSYCYDVIEGRKNFPITYVRWYAAIRFCNWLQNGQPTGAQDATTTESGSFTVAGEAVPGALWSLPTEDQWYKAAYYVPPTKENPTGSYFSFGTSNNLIPGNKLEEAVVANGANYYINGVATKQEAPRLTDVGTFINSASPWGAYDMAGNVNQWTSSLDETGNNFITRGGSWNSQSSDDLTSTGRFADPGMAAATTGFRVVYNVPPSPTISKISIDLVPVGEPGNDHDFQSTAGEPTFGSVSTGYQIGKYDVTAEQYCMFLNAVAKKDTHNLYNVNMATDPDVATIIRSGATDNYVYSVIPGREKLPITYVRWFAAIRFCNWLENAQPLGEQGPETTESGSFNANETGAFSVKPDAKWSLPTENQWYKAAYYLPKSNNNPNGSYCSFGTGNNTAPGNKLGDATLADRANYCLGGIYTTLTAPRLTPVGMFTASASPWGAFDMAGNVDQWTITPNEAGQSLVIRGGSWKSQGSNDLRFSSPQFADPSKGNSTTGFRVVYNVAPKVVDPTFFGETKRKGEIVLTTLNNDAKTLCGAEKDKGWNTVSWGGVLKNLKDTIYNGFDYMIGGSIGWLLHWLLNSGVQVINSFFNYLGSVIRYLFGDGAMSWLEGWMKTIYDTLFSPVDNVGRLAELKATQQAAKLEELRIASGLDRLGQYIEFLRQTIYTSTNAVEVVEAENNLAAAEEAAAEAAREEQAAAQIVRNAELAYARGFALGIETGEVAVSAEAAVVTEATLGSFFASPAMAVITPLVVGWIGTELIDSMPRYGIAISSTGALFGYEALRVFRCL